MAGTPAMAVRAFLGGLQQALSCVSPHVLVATGYRPEGGPHRLTTAGGEDVLLAGTRALRLRFGLGYDVQPAEDPGEGWEVEVRSYAYILERDEGGQELFAFHWHPTGPSATRWPHVHVGPASGVRPVFSGAHLPTGGPVALGEVLRFCVLDLGVRARRADWLKVLAAPEPAGDSA